MRRARVALSVIAILSIAFVLITPSLTDDVDGVLRPNHTGGAQKILSLPLPQSPILAAVTFLLSVLPSAARRLTATGLIDFGCVSRC
jgi:hypothetical protein